jgi:hypothetical protein
MRGDRRMNQSAAGLGLRAHEDDLLVANEKLSARLFQRNPCWPALAFAPGIAAA